MLDVRPAWEFDNGHISKSIHVPLFIEDTATDPTTLLKKWVVLGYGGAWQGNRLTKENDDFVSQVLIVLSSRLPSFTVGPANDRQRTHAVSPRIYTQVEQTVANKDTPIIVSCAEGLRYGTLYGSLQASSRARHPPEGFGPRRVHPATNTGVRGACTANRCDGSRGGAGDSSLCAAEILFNRGFTDVRWLQGGLNVVRVPLPSGLPEGACLKRLHTSYTARASHLGCDDASLHPTTMRLTHAPPPHVRQVTLEDVPEQSGNVAVQFASVGGVSQYFLQLAMLIKGDTYRLGDE